jgi:hypothetical protein
LGFAANDLIAQLTGRLVDAIRVGRHTTVDDRGTQSVCGVDDDLPGITGERIGREKNTGHLGRNHRLDHDADRDRDVFAKRAQVRKHPGTEEARPTGFDRLENFVFAHQIEQSRVHPRGRSALLIFVHGSSVIASSASLTLRTTSCGSVASRTYSAID